MLQLKLAMITHIKRTEDALGGSVLKLLIEGSKVS